MTLSLSPQTSASQFWQWEDYQIAYTVQGAGEPILLIHGFGACWGHWRKTIPALTAAGYQVYALDLLGFGESDKPVLDYDLTLWQRQIEAFWQAQIQAPVWVAGNSIGGLLALMVLADNPQWTRGGALLNCAGGLNHRPEELHFPLNWIMGVFTQAVSSPRFGPWMFERIRQKARIRNTLYQIYANRQAVTEELVDMLYQPSCDPNAQKVFASILSAPAGPKPEELLPRIQTPLLVLWGEKDPWTPISGAGIYQDREGIQFESFPQAGHCPQDDAPDWVNRRLLDWLATVA
ncbi:MAG: alpha/beta fold hydrolase [Cyanobacteriota bacterium]